MRRVLALSAAVPATLALAQEADPNAAFTSEVVVAELPGRTIAAPLT